MIWKFDRLARSSKKLIETVEDLDRRGIELKSLAESIDTLSQGGELMFHVHSHQVDLSKVLGTSRAEG